MWSNILDVSLIPILCLLGAILRNVQKDKFNQSISI